MSSGYASRLKEYPNKGICGLPEQTETRRCFASKRKQLLDMVQEAAASSRVVVFTGAGVSTSAGIPDFRGPRGIWTLEKKKKNEKESSSSNANNNKTTTTGQKRKHQERGDNGEDISAQSDSSKKKEDEKPLMDFSHARPTLTHRAIAFLVDKKVVNFCITQNVDGLHQRSGLARDKLAVLHGCVFTERCETCGTEHFGDQDVGGMSFQRTGRKCQAQGCQEGYLRDTLLDWKDPLPLDDLERSQQECDKADLVLCLGSSLRIEPAGSLPSRARKFVIINLQQTPYDDQASLIIRGKVDEVMGNLLCDLGFKDWETNWTPGPVQRLVTRGGDHASTWWKMDESDSDSDDDSDQEDETG